MKMPYCKCGEQNPNNFYKRKSGSWRFRCRKCDSEALIKYFRQQKIKAVEYKGGQCELCGYKKCLAALVFHHLDPNTKDPNWDSMKNRKFELIKKELDKCQLLCCLCHVEIHNLEGVWRSG